MSDNLEYMRKLLIGGYAQEAAEWVKDVGPLFTESESRAALQILAAAILDPKPRPGKFHGQKKMPPDYGGLVRRVPHHEWERQIFHAVQVHLSPDGRVKPGTYDDVANHFSTGRKNVEAIYRRLKNKPA